MSADHPQTLDEWKNFRFPVRDRSTLDEAARAVAEANRLTPAPTNEEEDDGDGTEGRGGGQGGSPALHPPGQPAPAETVEIAVSPASVTTPVTAPSSPVLAPPTGTPSSSGRAPVSPAATARPRAPAESPSSSSTPGAPRGPVHAAPDEVVSSPMGPGSGDSWTYDAARSLLINWRIEKAMVLAKMDTVARIRAFIGEVEKNHIDRWGFETALDEACKDVHKVSLAEILDTWPNDAKMRWSPPPEKACLPTSRPRRRSPSR